MNDDADGAQVRVRVYGDLGKLNRMTEDIRQKLAPFAQAQARLAANMKALQPLQMKVPPNTAIRAVAWELPDVDVEPIPIPEPAAHAIREEHRRDREQRQREMASWWPSNRDWAYIGAGALVTTLVNVPVYLFVLG